LADNNTDGISVLLTKQHRGREAKLEVPKGGAKWPDKTPSETAKRELKQETGTHMHDGYVELWDIPEEVSKGLVGGAQLSYAISTREDIQWEKITDAQTVDVAIVNAEDCADNIRSDFRPVVMRLIEYVRRRIELMWLRLRTHEDFTDALIHLTTREQNDAHQHNWRETYERELKKRVMAKRKNKRLSCVPTQWEMAILRLGADSESRRSYAEEIQTRRKP
jgi:ADP-ribose pyrophosphatase YjhB (NUDIX family)